MKPGNQELQGALLARINRIPIVATLGIEIVRFGDGTCESRVPRSRNYDGVFESFHGGLLMTVADSTACFAILTRTGPDTRLTTTDMNIRFLAACLTDVIAKARVIKFGRTLCPVAVDLFDTTGRQVALAQVTYMLLNR
ncbi:MAG: PaaI family thioesterase [Desulfobacterales bacterium]|jgi:uncharacterized protein (TIGR00369 family)|nr:PaaI family thioesterase [Desulfobacterales bacterium]